MGTLKQYGPVAPGVVRAAASVLLVTLLGACATAVPGGGIPRLDGKPDFSGIWESATGADFDLEPHANRPDAPPGRGVIEGDAIPYLPAALKQRQRNFAERETADPRLKGWTLGVPRGIYYPEPLQIFQRDQDLTIVFQFGHSVRTIYKNRTGHPGGEAQENWLGDSRAHWEGDTLVVDVRDFADDTWLDRSGNYHSTDLHVVERWTLLDANTIDYRATLDDPKVFSAPWSLAVQLHRHREPGFELIEDYRYTQGYDAVYPPRKEKQ